MDGADAALPSVPVAVELISQASATTLERLLDEVTALEAAAQTYALLAKSPVLRLINITEVLYPRSPLCDVDHGTVTSVIDGAYPDLSAITRIGQQIGFLFRSTSAGANQSGLAKSEWDRVHVVQDEVISSFAQRDQGQVWSRLADGCCQLTVINEGFAWDLRRESGWHQHAVARTRSIRTSRTAAGRVDPDSVKAAGFSLRTVPLDVATDDCAISVYRDALLFGVVSAAAFHASNPPAP